jgi:osmotically inducible protein OsmC
MQIERTASASWTGSLREGRGALSTQSGALTEHAYAFASRFEHMSGTNPEELIAAAHAGCFTMALSNLLAEKGQNAERLDTVATVVLEKGNKGFSIPTIKLALKGRVPGMQREQFESLAADAKANCPVSKLLNAEILLEVELS